jgi:N-acetylglucosamine kinase-like BadF-type ATPase
MGYLLGVDGGNTKTDYLLCTEDGGFVDVYRTGTCSHEAGDNGYDGMERAMRKQLGVILSRNRITLDDISSAGLGLAGADLPSQTAELKKRVGNIGVRRFHLANDGILGVKAASDNGVGICVVNGTATVVVGIDQMGKIQQVGGVGEVAGDLAGGSHARRQCIFHLYNYHYRCGSASGMFPELLGILNTSVEDLAEVARNFWGLGHLTVPILQLADREAQKGDAVAMKIFDDMGMNMGKSAAGCVKLLDFGGIGTDERPLPLVLVGSIWHKIAYTGMKVKFEETFRDLSKKACRLIPLNAPAAVGGVLWAKEILDGRPAEKKYRDKVLDSLSLEKYESLVFDKK